MLPIVLPPTVLGFYFLMYLGPNSAIGFFFEDTLGIEFAFSFEGILLGSLIYCLPFMLTPIISGFRDIPRNTVEATRMLKKTWWQSLIHVFVPYIRKPILTAILLTFAHTIGEFGVVLMIGGKMEETKVASVAIYDEMNKMNYEAAHTYALLLLLISFILIITMNILTKRSSDIA